jgi:glycosyltransferase involved in cell wall biosynthesis
VRIALHTNESPPHVYGGAGVHVEYLSRELARAGGGANHVDVLCFGEQNETHGTLRVRGIPAPPPLPVNDPRHGRLLDALGRNLAMAGALETPDIVHCHTW